MFFNKICEIICAPAWSTQLEQLHYRKEKQRKDFCMGIFNAMHIKRFKQKKTCLLHVFCFFTLRKLLFIGIYISIKPKIHVLAFKGFYATKLYKHLNCFFFVVVEMQQYSDIKWIHARDPLCKFKKIIRKLALYQTLNHFNKLILGRLF